MIIRRSFAAVLAATAMAVTTVAVPLPARAEAPVAVNDVRSQEWWLQSLGITKAWPLAKRGAGVTVGVLDSGVDVTHPDLRGAVVKGKDFTGSGTATGLAPVGQTGDGEPDYHGTEMAGYIAGRGSGGTGLLGVAPAARLLSASYDSETDNLIPKIGQGLRWLVDNGATVVNMSFGVGISKADLAYAQAKDVVLIAAAGNNPDRRPDQPSNQMGVVAVAGVVKNLSTWPSSSRGGPSIAGGDSLPPSASSGGIAVAGPAADGASDDDADGMVGLARTGTRYQRLLGTSNSTAIVSGVAALIRAAHPELNAANVISRLGQTARHVNPASGPGYSETQGFGVVDAYSAITLDVPNACENPFGSLASPQSFGLWKNVTNYKPTCQGRPTTSPSSTTPTASTSSSNEAIPPASSDSSSGVPVWVWPVVAVVVLAVIGGVVLARRSRRPAGPGPQPPYQGPPPGWNGQG